MPGSALVNVCGVLRPVPRSSSKVKVAVPNVPYYVSKVREYLPQAEIVIQNDLNEFFTRDNGNVDALVYSAEAGSAWSLMYPAYTVAVPHPDILAVPMAYGVFCAAFDVYIAAYAFKRRDEWSVAWAPQLQQATTPPA